jgi:hypothetical protein
VHVRTDLLIESVHLVGKAAGAQFKSHLKKSEAASDFSRNKTISQQRRSLPVFTVREELLQVMIRDA